MSKDYRVPASVLMSLGLAGCNLFGPCLSIVDSSPCLSVIDSSACDTNDPNDTDCPQDDTDAQEQKAETRADIIHRVLNSGVLPEDVAHRITE